MSVPWPVFMTLVLLVFFTYFTFPRGVCGSGSVSLASENPPIRVNSTSAGGAGASLILGMFSLVDVVLERLSLLLSCLQQAFH